MLRAKTKQLREVSRNITLQADSDFKVLVTEFIEGLESHSKEFKSFQNQTSSRYQEVRVSVHNLKLLRKEEEKLQRLLALNHELAAKHDTIKKMIS